MAWDAITQHDLVQDSTVQQQTVYLEGGHSSSLVFAGHVLLEHSQGNLVSPQMAVHQLNVHPELAEHNGLGQGPALLP